MDLLNLRLRLNLNRALLNLLPLLRLVVIHGGCGGVVDVSKRRQWPLVVKDVFERHDV